MHNDYHHKFALELAKIGHVVLSPELRGFGQLRDMAIGREGYRLDYWEWEKHSEFTLVTDGFLHGSILIGQTIEDLPRWENWLCNTRGITTVDVAVILCNTEIQYSLPLVSCKNFITAVSCL
ncbi:hypothetical protein ACFL4V_01775 [Candidatus Latescibacterota bacterium]